MVNIGVGYAKKFVFQLKNIIEIEIVNVLAKLMKIMK